MARLANGRGCWWRWSARRGVTTEAQARPAADPLRAIAERYVKLVLAVGQHDVDYVDAFYGPAEWKAGGRGARRCRCRRSISEAAALEGELAQGGGAGRQG